MEKNYSIQQKQIASEVKSLSALYDYAQSIHEKNFAERMEKLSFKLVDIFNDSLNPETADLYQLSHALKMDTTHEFMYIINRNGVIINTTFKKDLGLDFYKIDPEFKERFELFFNRKKFRADRFSVELNTGLIKKYSMIPTKDGKYLVELGFQSDDAQRLRNILDSLTHAISKPFPEIKDVYAELALKDVKLYAIKDSTLNEQALLAVKNKKNHEYRFTDPETGEDMVANFIYLPAAATDFFDGFLIMILRDTKKEKELIGKEIKRFAFVSLITVLPILLLIYIRSRKITLPIKKLAQKASVISGGNLNERIEVEGNNEITILSENFNKMIEQLQESYEGLEQKVRDRTAEITQQKHIIEEKQKEIVDSINYAKRIQDAILPTNQAIEKVLPEAFVLYKPKDIIAGDFYWMETREKLVLIAAADCTGHGVPGAMVSVVCSGALTRSVKEFGLTNPGKVLDKTTELVLETLDKNHGDVKDGMDISLCNINLNQNVLMYAGANNPLWIFRRNKSDTEPEFIEIKADKQPIGKFENRKPFSTQIHEIEPGDCIYMFTDGYADQFGGPKGKKFKYSTLQKLLAGNCHLPVQEQKDIFAKAFDEWKGTYEQTDDVCIIGIKF